MKRTEAREYAFILLFQYRFQPDEMDVILKDFLDEHDAGEQLEYIEDVVKGTVKNIKEIDERINNASKEWTVERISAVSIAVIRLSVYEMLYRNDIPNMVSLNEAIKIAKKYEGDEVAAFLNGVLDNIQKSVL